MQETWNKRYGEITYAYGKEPNEFFKKELSKLSAGKILFLGEGEGRNSVLAAKNGWIVDAIDFSATAKDKALSLAKENNVEINFTVADLSGFIPKVEYYDAVVLIFLHLEENLRTAVHAKAIASLKSGGTLIFQSFEKEQINKNSGGPKITDLLYSLEDIISDFQELDFAALANETSHLTEGEYHNGEASVITFVGKK